MEHPTRSLELAAMIGEMKAPRVIKAKEWLFERPASSVTRRLQQELRAYDNILLPLFCYDLLTEERYTYEYQCPQVFVFDTKSLVIIQFHASNHHDIANEDCPIDCCVIPRRMNIENQCTMQYALYRLAWRGWIRLSATLESKTLRTGELVRARKSVSLYVYERKYVYWSGEPVWFDRHGGRYTDHPLGYRREFVYRFSSRRDGTLKMKGVWVWRCGEETYEDTPDCFISNYNQLR